MNFSRRSFLTFLVLALFAAGCAAPDVGHRKPSQAGPVRVACVGDSITYGAGVQGRETNSYPAVLGRMLGNRYEVRNFGVSGATLLQRGDHPWWKTKAFADATDFGPDVVIIKLGTNDSKPQNWAHKGEFAADAKALVGHFRALSSRPLVYLCLPVPVYQDRWGINEATVKGEVIPILRSVAKELRVPLVDLHGAMRNRAEVFPDGVHPNHVGAAQLAQAVLYEIGAH